jgi:hypothetical protein
MTLQKWVANMGGPVKVAPMLKVTVHAVRRWLRKESAPRTDTMTLIVQVSKGKCSYKDIIESSTPLPGEVVPKRQYTNWGK